MILDQDEIEHDEKTPLICLDEKPVPLTSHVRDAIPMKPGKTERVDFGSWTPLCVREFGNNLCKIFSIHV